MTTHEEQLSSSAPVTVGMLTRAIDAVVAAIKERDAHIRALEQRPHFEYRGVWDPRADYDIGDLVTDRGSMFHCWEPTHERPGETDAWQLCVKHGRDLR